MDDTVREIAPPWSAVFGKPPAVLMDGSTMIAILVETLPEPAAFAPFLPITRSEAA